MSEKLITKKLNFESKAKSSNQKTRFLNDKEESEHPPQMRNAQRFFRKPKATQEMIVLPQPTIQYGQPYVPKPTPIPEAIKQIDKKIKAYRRVMERERQEKLQRELQEQQKQNENEEEMKRTLDFMTNPQIVDQKEEEEAQQLEVEEDQQFFDEESRLQEEKPRAKIKSEKISYQEAVKKREEIYDHTLQRMYEKRQNPLLFAKFKKKPPILNITSKNKITKGNGKLDPEEHKLRVFNRENVPTMPDLIIPSFTIKKDQMAKNILAYLKEYTPLFRGFKNYEYPKCVQNILQEEIDQLPKQ
ncbi:unnamed protein product [Paramecium sonneborni]|uniref:Uncharacterized protein n=1 Tax=Paramecium sonneborni TaxID=65129 RepID=A0A8S1NCR3_9CILI|nr:unnamed protein product [Paramecium sonneborni]